MNARDLLIALGTVLSLVLVASALAQDPPNQAALVVSLGDGRTETRCVEFVEAEISGLDLLQRSGLQLDIEFQSGGAFVCNIQGTGCPPTDCLCQCQGGPNCLYWSYWQLTEGQWTYSLAGAGAYRVQDGAVQGWSWGPGSVTDAIPPPATSFDAVCQVAAPATNTPVPTSPPVILPTLPPAGGGATATVRPSPSATVVPATATGTLPVPTATREEAAEATVEPTSSAVMLPPPTVTQSPAEAPGAASQPATESPVPLPTSRADSASTDNGADEVTGLGPSIIDQSPTPASTEEDIPQSTMATEPAIPTMIASIENNPVLAVTAVVREVVGDTVGGVPPSAPVVVADPDAGPEQNVPLARYAIFGALVVLLAALFGFVYLRRAGAETGREGHRS